MQRRTADHSGGSNPWQRRDAAPFPQQGMGTGSLPPRAGPAASAGDGPQVTGVRLSEQRCRGATSFSSKPQPVWERADQCITARKTDPAGTAGTAREGAEAGTAATSPVTPERAAVLKSQGIQPGTRMGRWRWSKSDASSFAALAGPTPTAAPIWGEGAAASEITYPLPAAEQSTQSHITGTGWC